MSAMTRGADTTDGVLLKFLDRHESHSVYIATDCAETHSQFSTKYNAEALWSEPT